MRVELGRLRRGLMQCIVVAAHAHSNHGRWAPCCVLCPDPLLGLLPEHTVPADLPASRGLQSVLLLLLLLVQF